MASGAHSIQLDSESAKTSAKTPRENAGVSEVTATLNVICGRSGAKLAQMLLGDAHKSTSSPLECFRCSTLNRPRWRIMLLRVSLLEAVRRDSDCAAFLTDRQTDRQFTRARSRTPHDVLSRRSTNTRSAHR